MKERSAGLKTAIPKTEITASPQVVSARYSACGRFLFAGSFAGQVRRWDLLPDDPIELDAFDGHNGWVESVVSHGDMVYSADSWGCIQAWSCNDAAATRWTLSSAHDGWCRQLALSPEGKFLASCGRDGIVNVWRAEDGARVQQIKDPNTDVFCVRFTDDGERLLTGDFRGCVREWEASSAKHIRDFDASVLHAVHRLQDCGGVRCLGMGGVGKQLFVGGTRPSNGGTVRGVPTVLVFDFDSGELLNTLELGADNDCFVHDLQIHEDGFLMAVTSGTPGSGRLLFQELDAESPFFVAEKLINCHSLSRSPGGTQLAVTTTNRKSNGNGRRLNDNGEYEGNVTPIHLLELNVAEQAET